MAKGSHAPRLLTRDGGGFYVIQVQGEVEPHWELELQMRLVCDDTDTGVVSTFSGALPDQAALLGALGRLAMWGYLILLVRHAPELEPAGCQAGTDPAPVAP